MTTDEEYRRLLEEARAMLNRPLASRRPPPQVAEPGVSNWTRLDKLIAPIHWAWPGWLPHGFVTILAGEPGAGKSLLALHLAALYLNAAPWPDGTPFAGAARRVIWCEAESSQALNLERARRWELNLAGFLSPLKNPMHNFNPGNPGHDRALLALAQQESVGLIIVDSLRGLRVGSNPPSIAQVMLILAEIARVAAKPLLLTHHLRKGSARPGTRLTQDHLLGAGAIIQTARVIWALDAPDPATPDHRRLSVIKNNLASPPQPLGFSITDEGLHFGPPPTPPARAPALDAALHFLRQTLAAGPLPAREIRTRAEAAGIAWRTLKRAKKDLAIRSFRPPGEGQWHWQLPEK